MSGNGQREARRLVPKSTMSSPVYTRHELDRGVPEARHAPGIVERARAAKMSTDAMKRGKRPLIELTPVKDERDE